MASGVVASRLGFRHGRQLLLLLACLLLSWPGQQASARQSLGTDLPFQWYADGGGSMTLAEFLALPDDRLQVSHSIVSLGFARTALWVRLMLPASLFEGEERWLQLGPSFVDHVTLYYRQIRASGEPSAWVEREAGDLASGVRGDFSYRFPVFQLAPPGPGDSYEVVLRASSSSAVMIDASLWTPASFATHAALTTAFWGFYFGLAAFATGLALVMALYLNRRLAWALFAFSVSYFLVACIEGYVDWLVRPWWPRLQHYLSSSLTLWAFGSVLWVCMEALDLRRYLPRLYRWMIGCLLFLLLLQLSIPFDFYHQAVTIQGYASLLAALIFVGSAVYLYRRGAFDTMQLALSLMPMVYVLAGVLALASLAGMIPYHREIYAIWQYVLIGNMLIILLLVGGRLREEARANEEKRMLAHDLRTERELSFHQRQFMGMVSHEFRTPLMVIAGALQNLRLPMLSEAQREHRYRKIERANQRLVQLTDNCLADSRLEATALQVEWAEADLVEVVTSAAELVDSSDQHRWRLTWEGGAVSLEDPPRLVCRCDAALLRIALCNLLGNAVKYSALGTITVDLARVAGQVRLRVTDQGHGVAPEHAETIFDRYRRAPVGSDGMGVAGAGLGLYVARQIALAHGGGLRLAATGPEGSCFELTLPCEPPSSASPT